MDFSDIFMDEDEYDRLKLEETKQMEDKGMVNWKPEKMKAFYIWASTDKKLIEISEMVGVHRTTLTQWAKDFNRMTNEAQIS